jgi:hypothetical protein
MTTTARPLFTSAKLFPRTRHRNPHKRVPLIGCNRSNWRPGSVITLERDSRGYPLVNKSPVVATPVPCAGIVNLSFFGIVWTVSLADYEALFPCEKSAAAEIGESA